MRLELTGRHVRITAPLKRLVDERLEKLDRLFHERAVSIQVVLYLEKYRHRVEMTLHARGDHFLHGTGGGANWEIALNQALGKINQQVRKLKGKWDDGKRQRVSAAKVSSAAPRPERGGRGFGEGRRAAGDGGGGARRPGVGGGRRGAGEPRADG